VGNVGNDAAVFRCPGREAVRYGHGETFQVRRVKAGVILQTEVPGVVSGTGEGT
jgi:hypothetical protein